MAGKLKTNKRKYKKIGGKIEKMNGNSKNGGKTEFLEP
jgi:hypothetical protein